jgi:hypothetical protein
MGQGCRVRRFSQVRFDLFNRLATQFLSFRRLAELQQTPPPGKSLPGLTEILKNSSRSEAAWQDYV